jgi:glutamate carboxypeptidase
MKKIVAVSLPHTSSTFLFNPGYPPMALTPSKMKVLAVLSKVSEDMGISSVQAYDPGRRGTADISFVVDYVDGLDGLGTFGSETHSPREVMDIPSFKKLTQGAALLIYRLSQMKGY